MSQGNDFNYSAATDAGTAGSEEVWFVAVASDDIKQMNVDQLDEAFRLGIVTEDTAVWTEGMEAWQPLGQVLGGDSDEAAPAAHDEPGFAEPGFAEPGFAAAPAAAPSPVSAATTATGGFGAVTLQSVQHSYAPGPLSFAPVTSSLAPSAHTNHNLGQNVVPGSLSIDEDVPMAPPARRFRPERWALAAAAVVAVGVAVYNNFSSSVASAGTQAPAPTALAARPYDGADPADKDGVDKGGALEDKSTSLPSTVPAKASDDVEGSPIVEATKGVAAVAAATAAASIASEDGSDEKGSSKKADKDSLKGSFSKAFNSKKAGASEPRARATKSAKVKPRKAASRATTKSRAKAKKPSVARSQSAFDPLNDSLP